MELPLFRSLLIVTASACLTGFAVGTLDDGIGPGPDYVVDGAYVGLSLYGIAVGGFDLELRKPTGEDAGSMYGYFVDLARIEGGLLSLFTASYDVAF